MARKNRRTPVVILGSSLLIVGVAAVFYFNKTHETQKKIPENVAAMLAEAKSLDSDHAQTYDTKKVYTFWKDYDGQYEIFTADTRPIEVGMKFKSLVDGKITGMRFYKGKTSTGEHVGTLWTEYGKRLASVTFTKETESGWQEAMFDEPVSITGYEHYVVSYFAPHGNYAISDHFMTRSFYRGPLQTLSNDEANGNGVYRLGKGYPTESFNEINYWVDVLFIPSDTHQVKHSF